MAETPNAPQPTRESRTPWWVYAVGAVLIVLALGYLLLGGHMGAGGGIPHH